MKLTYLLILLTLGIQLEATLAGGRLNAFSEGQNAFAGVINPANAVWVHDRVDAGAYFSFQKASLNNKGANPFFPKGKTDLTYHAKSLFTADIAIHKRFTWRLCDKERESSLSLAFYTTPNETKLKTKHAIPVLGSTPLSIRNKTQVVSLVFSHKISANHSLGISFDYFLFTHLRNGFQNADNPLRSISPGHVTNNGYDHSSGAGLTLGWRWNISKRLAFGTAWSRKSHCGSYRKYRGYEPHHAKNYSPQLFGAGFRYLFSDRLAGRIEMLWSNFGNLPGSNNNFLPNGKPNLNKRGSKRSPGPGLQDATYINLGLGYKWNEYLAVGAGLSHRIKLHSKRNNFFSHSYRLHAIYDIISAGAAFKYKKHELFLGATCGIKNRTKGNASAASGGGLFISEKQTASISASYGYLF